MSVVYKGVYEPLDQPVAIKILKSHLVSDLPTFQRFQQEAKTAGALEHPNIVAVYDFGVTDQGVPYLVMELVNGESLLKLVRSQTPFPINIALRIFSQTADALDYTHQRGVIHRDIKPSNMLVQNFGTGQETVKILDFGIAKLQNYQGNPAANLTRTGEVFGTPLYISPEQAMGKPVDLRADIYSLGCVMYETVTGQPPFNGPTAFDVIRLQCTVKHTPIYASRAVSEVPPSLVAAIDRCMEKTADLRYQSMQELLATLHQAQMEREYLKRATKDGHDPQTVLADLVRQSGLVEQPTAAAPELLKIAASAVSPTAAAPSMRAQTPVRLRAADLQMPRMPARMPLRVWTILISGLAGMLAGAVILMNNHAAPPSASPSQSQALESETAGSKDNGLHLDAEIQSVREQALNAYDQGNFTLALDQITKALSVARDQHDTVAAGLLLSDQCMIFVAMKRIQDALDSGTASLKILDEKPNVPKKDLSFALRALGTACFYDNDLGQAEELLRRSTVLDEVVYGRSDERYAIGVGRLAKVLEAEKKYDEAEKYYRQALAVSQSAHHPGDKHLVMRMYALSQFLRLHHHVSEAQSLETQAQTLENQEANGPQHK